MTTGVQGLDFKNSWYSDGIRHAIKYVLPNQEAIRIFTASYFIASKIEAFRDKGNNELKVSRDFEDIVFIIDHREKIIDEIAQANKRVKQYIIEEFAKLLTEFDGEEAVIYNIISHTADIINKIMGRLREISTLKV